MGIIIDEKQMIENNVFQFEEKLKSPLSRFLDTTPTFVNYYHLDSDETTTDEGFKDVASLIGHRSPIKYKKIKNFPLYGIEQIVLQLQEGDQGLDTDYTGEANILPNTIKPLQNDYFVIPYLHDSFLFRVTEITYDSVMPDNFYRIGYKLEYIDDEMITLLDNQVRENYNCVLENIGSENKCIIESDYMTKIDRITELYEDMKSTYLSLFYDQRHNCILGELGGGLRLYDPYMTEFINKHSLFNKKNDMEYIMLTDQFTDPRRRVKYEKSVYRFIERRDVNLINNFKFAYYAGTMQHESSFYRWHDKSIQIVDIGCILPDDAVSIFSDEFVEAVRINGFVDSEFASLIQKFIREKQLSLDDIPLDLNQELLNFNTSLEVFFFTPIILYIIKETINGVLKEKK